MATADTPDLPLTPPGNAGAPSTGGAKPALNSKTIGFLALAALVQFAQQVATLQPGYEWLIGPLGQLQMFVLGLVGMSRAVATGPLK